MSEHGHQVTPRGTTPGSSVNEFSAPTADQSQYITPSASIPDEYWRQAAQAKVAARSVDTSTVACWLLVLVGLVLPIFALGSALWALWMSRDDSRFLIPAAVGFGIFAMPFLG